MAAADTDPPGALQAKPVDRGLPRRETGAVSPSAPSSPQMPAQRALLGIGCRVMGVACLAIMGGAVKWASQQGVPVFEIVFFRNAFAFLPLGLYIWRTTGFSVLKTSRPGAHLARSIIGIVGMVLSFAALARLPLSEVTAIQFATPLFTTALSVILLKEVVGRHRWGALLVGFVGVLIMVRPQPGHFDAMGVAFALGSAVGAAGAMVAIRSLAATEPGPTIVFFFTLSGTLVGLAGCLVEWVTPDPLTLGVLAFSGVLGGLAQLFLTQSLRLAPLGLAAPFDYTQLLWATLLGFVLWGDLPGAATLAGAALVAASGVYILQRELRRFRRPEP